MKRLLILSVVSLVVLSSCHHFFAKKVRGNGNIKTESRTTSNFTRVEVSGEMDVYVKNDSVRSVRVEADENLMEYIEVVSEGDKIYIHEAEGYNLLSTREIKVYVSSPEYKGLEASGACNIYGENQVNSSEGLSIDLSGASDIKLDLKSPKVNADLSGSCKLELKGQTKDFKVSGSGSSDINCIDLMAENVDVDISGSGEAELFASIKLNVEVSGSGDIKYKGNAAVSQSISGSGSVKKID